MTVNVKNDPNYYGDQYLKLAFSVDFWGTRSYLPQVGLGMLQPPALQRDALAAQVRRGPDYLSLYKQALEATDPTKRCDIIDRDAEARVRRGRVHHPVLQQPRRRALSSKVAGFKASKATLNLDTFGHGYRTIWFA